MISSRYKMWHTGKRDELCWKGRFLREALLAAAKPLRKETYIGRDENKIQHMAGRHGLH